MIKGTLKKNYIFCMYITREHLNTTLNELKQILNDHFNQTNTSSEITQKHLNSFPWNKAIWLLRVKVRGCQTHRAAHPVSMWRIGECKRNDDDVYIYGTYHEYIVCGYLYLNFTIPMLPVSLDCHVLIVLRFSLMFIYTQSSGMVDFLISLLAKV